jgi:hypothetical protein
LIVDSYAGLCVHDPATWGNRRDLRALLAQLCREAFAEEGGGVVENCYPAGASVIMVAVEPIPPEATMSARNLALSRRWFEEAWNEGRTETIR